MPLSPLFKELRTRLTELRKHLLPQKFSPTGSYTARVQDRARAYRLLVHAEIESYLENITRQLVTDKIKEWKKDRKPSNLMLALMACYHSGWIDFDEEHNQTIIERAKNRKKIKKSVEELVDLAQKQFIALLKENHGIREKNLKNLVLPTGVDMDELDDTWKTDLDDFGQSRGAFAHQSKKTTGSVNPQDEYKRVQRIVLGLKELDRKLNAIS